MKLVKKFFMALLESIQEIKKHKAERFK